ncbi:hypothetical protein ACFOY8_13600 [Thalassospira xianhensis]|uniref:Uncharacterized protein n=2 Tax=Thalassospira TaxID=168934 RepID=A0A285TSI6_9PROT|nr:MULTISPECIES: hypothetical protein [Thalassospira]RCK07780.1 hypothetical protein TH5_01680 [Thalassospira xianhensis MCCC 1A02616]SOC26901.1 hypothetical protein SAMN05428964_105229 [Thalassospira xiamenensis]
MSYTVESLEEALSDIRVNHMPVPEAFKWGPSYIRDGLSFDQFRLGWPELPLERRIGLTALLIGPSIAEAKSRIITSAYRDLCVKGALDLHEAGDSPSDTPALKP